jgi:methylglyoxal reductase
MKTRPLGGSGIEASVVGLGCWAIGGSWWGGSEEQQSIKAIQAAIDNGISLVDTAPVYGFGYSEEVVGKAIRDRRDKVILATKCGLVWDQEAGDFFFKMDGKTVHRYLGRDSIRNEVEVSLKRLNTDRIDLLQTHWQESTTPQGETQKALLELKEEGKIRAIGVSNVNLSQLKAYQAEGPVDSAQEKYSMIDRGLEEELLPYCRESNVAMLAYSPLALGLLTGKIGPEREFPKGDQRRGNKRFSAENRQRVLDLL